MRSLVKLAGIQGDDKCDIPFAHDPFIRSTFYPTLPLKMGLNDAILVGVKDDKG